MPNTARTVGNYDIKIFMRLFKSKACSILLDVLTIRDDASHTYAVDLVGELMDETGDDPEHPLYRLIHVLTNAIEHYESKIYSANTAGSS